MGRFLKHRVELQLQENLVWIGLIMILITFTLTTRTSTAIVTVIVVKLRAVYPRVYVVDIFIT